MIIGGYLASGSSGTTDTVLKYDSNNLNNDPIQMEPMLTIRSRHACTIFNSALHDGRPILIVASGIGSSIDNTAEILDFLKEGTSWQECNIIFIISTLSVFVFSMLYRVKIASDFSYALIDLTLSFQWYKVMT